MLRRDAKNKTSTLVTTTPAFVQTTLVTPSTQASPHIGAIAGDAEVDTSATDTAMVTTGAVAALMPSMGAINATAEMTAQTKPTASAIAALRTLRHSMAGVGKGTPKVYRTAENRFLPATRHPQCTYPTTITSTAVTTPWWNFRRVRRRCAAGSPGPHT